MKPKGYLPCNISRSFMPALFLLVMFLFVAPAMRAQTVTGDPAFSLSLERSGTYGNPIAQGGILYEGDLVKGVLRFDEKKWDGKNKYCYVFHYTDMEPGVTLLFPVNAYRDDNLLPKRNSDGTVSTSIRLFEGMISAPFGRDNFVLVITDKPLATGTILDETRMTGPVKQELLKLVKGSPLSTLYQEGIGAIRIKSLHVESRPAAEKQGLTKNAAGLQTVFAVNDSAEIFYTPTPQRDIVRDSFPTVEIIDPVFDTSTMRGTKVLSSTAAKKVLMRGIAVDWRRGIRQITINGQAASTYRESSGYFDFLYEPKQGTNVAYVAVTNNRGYTRTLRLKFIYQPVKETVAAEGKDYLLVIGINQYQSWPQLKNAQKDAADFSHIMRENFGFKPDYTKEFYNSQATRKNIYAQLRSFVNDLNPNDRLLIYFSGHGYYDSTLELGYWIPADANENSSEDYLNNLDITRMVQKMKAKSIFVIADACYSGQLLRDMQKAGGGDYKSRLVLCSGKLQPVPDGVPGTNSPFAKQVLDYLQNAPGKEIRASELIQSVKNSFKATDKQKPVGGAIDEVGDENGDFLLKRIQ